jgi:ubiquinone/menaquinone biosynthesis C-methylase UbiE
MITKSPIKKNPKYYEALGSPKGIMRPVDFYRFKRVRRHLVGKTVLDIGSGRADFLNLIKKNHRVTGIEINKQRVDYCNRILGQDCVKLGNLDERLNFEDNSFDTVVCLEVLEHLEDPESALKELVRVSRKRVIVTVPFNEKIQYVLCLHCAKYTPHSGHLHSFNEEDVTSLVPSNVRIVKLELIGNSALNYFPLLRFVFRLPIFISSIIDRVCNLILPRAGWMVMILDKT